MAVPFLFYLKHFSAGLRLRGRMRNKILLCSLAAALVVGGFTLNQALAAEKIGLGSHGQIFQRIAQKLQLTADQRSEMKKVLSGEKDNLKPLLSAVQVARKDLRAAIRATDANESSVRAAAAKVASAEADLAVERMTLFAKLSPILTEKQRAKISEFAWHMDGAVDEMIARAGEGLAD